MAKLRPLRDDLAPEVRQLTEFLRAHFLLLRTSIRDYALHLPWDAGTISRFLSGDRIPRMNFIDTLLGDAGPQRSPEEAEQEHAQARELLNRALRVCNARAAESERIAQELSDVEHEIQLAGLRERALCEALLRREQEVVSLEEKYSLLQSSQGATRSRPRFELESSQQQLTRLDNERMRAQKEIARLNHQLSKERQARQDAEGRRDQLLVALNRANTALVRTGGSAIEVPGQVSESQLLKFLRERRTILDGLINFMAVYIIIYISPVYLGLVWYRLPGIFGYLKTVTVVGLSISIWLTFRLKALGEPSLNFRVSQVLRVMFSVVALFFLGILAEILFGSSV